MNNLRIHGNKPFSIAVVHGGPGARGEMYPVACAISAENGVLEPLQTASSVEGQVEELKTVLEDHGQPPLLLIGFSWGAWLSYLLTAYHPALVRKLILISSGPFEEKYAAQIMETRLSHLDQPQRQEVLSLLAALNCDTLDAGGFTRFGELMGIADSFDQLPQKAAAIEGSQDFAVFQRVWTQAAELRRTGELLKAGQNITCPVVAIQGDYDPHPAAGIKEPLSRVLKDFRFILLKQCGHCPWIERSARDDFYRTLMTEIRPA
jgi:pimeloyl-ACP methyl ester carboxylesterase